MENKFAEENVQNWADVDSYLGTLGYLNDLAERMVQDIRETIDPRIAGAVLLGTDNLLELLDAVSQITGRARKIVDQSWNLADKFEMESCRAERAAS